MRKLARVIENIAVIAGHFSALLIVIMVLLIVFEAIMRYFFRNPPLLADELSCYMLVAVSFLGLAYAWKERAHIRVLPLVTTLPTRVSNWLRLFTLILALVFTIALVIAGYEFLERSFVLNRTSASWLRVPLKWPEMTIVVGLLLLALMIPVSIGKAIANIRAGRRIEEKPE